MDYPATHVSELDGLRYLEIRHDHLTYRLNTGAIVRTFSRIERYLSPDSFPYRWRYSEHFLYTGTHHPLSRVRSEDIPPGSGRVADTAPLVEL